MMTILAAIGAIPEIIATAKEIIKFLKSVFGDDPKKFFKDANEVFAKLSEAKTPEEKQKSAREIQDLIRRL